MKKQSDDHQYQKFWFGFAVGSVVCGALATAVGTKQGRSAVRRAVEFMEDVDTKPDQVHQMIDAVYEMYREIKKDPDTSLSEERSPSSPPTSSSASSENEKSRAKKSSRSKSSKQNSMEAVIDKVRSISSQKK